MKSDEAAELQCDSGKVAEHLPPRLDEFDSLFWDPRATAFAPGVSASLGHNDFKYLDQTTLAELSTDRTPWSASAFLGYYLPGGHTLLAGGAAYVRTHKAADTKTICPPFGDERVECSSGPLGTPVENTKKLLFAELRHQINGRPFSLKVAHEFEKGELSADLPIYLFNSTSAGWAGGVRVTWVEGKDPDFGVFASTSFSLFN